MPCSYRQINPVERRKINDLLAWRFRVSSGLSFETGENLPCLCRLRRVAYPLGHT